MKVLPFGLRCATKDVLRELHVESMHLGGRIASIRYRHAHNLKIHMGCGNNIKPGWLNVDLRQEADLKLDLRRPIPLPSECAVEVYSEHFLEHVDYPEPIGGLLRESLRLLEPGGKLTCAIPDHGWVVQCYANGGPPEFHEANRSSNPAWCQTPMEHLNYCLRQEGQHKFAYDYETFEQLLSKNGFTRVRRREFDPELDQKERIVGSLYVECFKPAAGEL